MALSGICGQVAVPMGTNVHPSHYTHAEPSPSQLFANRYNDRHATLKKG